MASFGEAKIHRFELGRFYGESKKIVGESPLLMAISDDAVYYAVGPDAMTILHRALTQQNDVRTPSPISLEFSIARLWPLLPAGDKNREKLQELFPAGREGSIRLNVEGGSTLSIRVTAHQSLVQFMGHAVGTK